MGSTKSKVDDDKKVDFIKDAKLYPDKIYYFDVKGYECTVSRVMYQWYIKIKIPENHVLYNVHNIKDYISEINYVADNTIYYETKEFELYNRAEYMLEYIVENFIRYESMVTEFNSKSLNKIIALDCCLAIRRGYKCKISYNNFSFKIHLCFKLFFISRDISGWTIFADEVSNPDDYNIYIDANGKSWTYYKKYNTHIDHIISFINLLI